MKSQHRAKREREFLMRQLTVSGIHKSWYFYKDVIVSIFTKHENGQKAFSFSVFKLAFLSIENKNRVKILKPN